MHVDASTVGELIRPYLIYSYVLALTLTILVLVGFTRFVLLRTAPPLYRLQRFIERAGDGNLSAGLDWLEHDEFRETARALDTMVEALRGRLAGVKRAAEDVVEHSVVLGHVMDKPHVAVEKCGAMLDRLKALRSELEAVRRP
jgi:methyl-accepting chemotaxis protein